MTHQNPIEVTKPNSNVPQNAETNLLEPVMALKQQSDFSITRNDQMRSRLPLMAIKQINDFSLPTQKNVGTIDDKVQHLNNRIKLKKEGKVEDIIINNNLQNSPIITKIDEKPKIITRKDALAIQRQVKKSFRNFERLQKKQTKKFNKISLKSPEPKKIAVTYLVAKNVQNSLYETTQNMDSFRFWVKPMRIINKIEEKAVMYEQEQQRKFDIFEKLSNLQVADEITHFSDESEMISCSAMLEQDYGKLNKLLNTEIEETIYSDHESRVKQIFENKNKLQEIVARRDSEEEDKIQPHALMELDHLDKQYKKTEYNAQRKHHHNIHTMDKFKDLLTGDIGNNV